MLRNKGTDEGWSADEMLQEQLHFQRADGTIAPIVHKETNEPYYAYELAEIYAKREFKRLLGEYLKSLPRKRAFDDNGIVALHEDRAKGLSIRELARKYNKSTSTIQKYLGDSKPNALTYTEKSTGGM